MKKIIFKSILFFVILALLLGYVSYVFIPKNNTLEAGILAENGLVSLTGEKENTIDAVVLGNSESFTSLVPMKLWEDCGYTLHICGYPGVFLGDTIKILHTIAKTQKPKLVIVEANVIFDEGSLKIPLSRVIQEVLPVTEYHDRWKYLRYEDFYEPINNTATDYMKGFHYKTIVTPADTTGYMDYTDEVQELSWKAKLYLKILKAYAESFGGELMIISVPNTQNWNYQKHNGVQQFSDSENIKFLDYNLITDELNLDWNTDTIDAGDHMNFAGSTKLTNYFEKYIKQYNILESHKGDSNYASWDEDLIKFKEEINREGSGK